MNELVEILNNEVITTSKQVAEVFGKEHKNVMRDISKILEQSGGSKMSHEMFVEDTFENRGKQYPMYIMNRDGFTLLAMGFNGSKAMEFKLKYIEAFNEMENELKSRNKFDGFASLPLDQQLLQIAGAQSERLDKVESQVTDLVENRRIDSSESQNIGSAVRGRVKDIVQRNNWSYNQVRNTLFPELNGEIKKVFGVPNRGYIKSKDVDKVIEFINCWEPSSATRFKIKQMSLFE